MNDETSILVIRKAILSATELVSYSVRYSVTELVSHRVSQSLSYSATELVRYRVSPPLS